ncbi:hypothetical protein PR048_020296 [Dryococelus australis]|uniref:Uncharacterized protein n=1 Tax=Dryococelus australis TaxID=614101 RepID=A0ABQ9H5Z0_9NEOP|nr:hypothetical protein PR048_020296 [Dryococelus australis]
MDSATLNTCGRRIFGIKSPVKRIKCVCIYQACDHCSQLVARYPRKRLLASRVFLGVEAKRYRVRCHGQRVSPIHTSSRPYWRGTSENFSRSPLSGCELYNLLSILCRFACARSDVRVRPRMEQCVRPSRQRKSEAVPMITRPCYSHEPRRKVELALKFSLAEKAGFADMPQIYANGVGELCFIVGIMGQKLYINILMPRFPKSVHDMNDYICIQDNDPKHAALNTKLWLLYNTPHWRAIAPPQLPYINPTDNLWKIIGERILIPDISNKNYLKKALLDERKKIPEETADCLVGSIPRRLQGRIVKKKVMLARDGSDKGYTVRRIKCAIATKRRALNRRAVLSLSYAYLWEFKRRPCHFIGAQKKWYRLDSFHAQVQINPHLLFSLCPPECVECQVFARNEEEKKSRTVLFGARAIEVERTGWHCDANDKYPVTYFPLPLYSRAAQGYCS